MIACNVLKRVKKSLLQNRANLYSDCLKRFETGAFFADLKPDARFGVFLEKSTFNNVKINQNPYFLVTVVLMLKAID